MRAPDHDAADDAGGGDGADKTADTAANSDDAAVTADLAATTADTGTGDDKEDKSEPDGPPEAYELKVTVKGEDGADSDVEIDQVLLDEATPVLKDLKLTNEQANKLAPLALKIQERTLTRQADEFAATRAEWAKQIQADPELGGKNWKETSALVGKALDHFAGGPEKNPDGSYKSEFRQLLVDTGLTNHPAMAKMLRAIGAAASEDGTFARGEDKPAPKKSREEIMYPDDAPKQK